MKTAIFGDEFPEISDFLVIGIEARCDPASTATTRALRAEK